MKSFFAALVLLLSTALHAQTSAPAYTPAPEPAPPMLTPPAPRTRPALPLPRAPAALDPTLQMPSPQEKKFRVGLGLSLSFEGLGGLLPANSVLSEYCLNDALCLFTDFSGQVTQSTDNNETNNFNSESARQAFRGGLGARYIFNPQQRVMFSLSGALGLLGDRTQNLVALDDDSEFKTEATSFGTFANFGFTLETRVYQDFFLRFDTPLLVLEGSLRNQQETNNGEVNQQSSGTTFIGRFLFQPRVSVLLHF